MLSRFRFPLCFTASLLLFAAASQAQIPVQEQMPMPHYPWTNSDGSRRLALEFGGGGAPTVGTQRSNQDHGWIYRMGGGFRFRSRTSVMAEYTLDHFDIPSHNVPVGAAAESVGGVIHLWSITLIPTYEFAQKQYFSAYVLGGGGFYRKNLPGYNSSSDASDSGGFEGGLGIYEPLTAERTVKLFAEGRYVSVGGRTAPDGFPSPENRTSFLSITGGLRW